MTVRRTFSVVAALLAVFVGGCSDHDSAPLPAETDEPFYVQGKQLMKQGRNPEALTAFLKVIDRRGERGAPESHLEAGTIYLNYTKDPLEAYHHFRKYLDLQPNSKEAVRVRGMVQAAQREFARMLPARPLEDQSQKLQSEDTIEKLQRENEELKARLATLRGADAIPVGRSTPTISLPEDAQSRSTPPVAPVVNPSANVAATTPPRSAPAIGPQIQLPSNPQQTTQTTPTRTNPTPTRSQTPPPTRGGRTYTVKQSDGLWGIARQFDPANPGKKLQEIIDANPEVLSKGKNTPLKPGMVLKIP